MALETLKEIKTIDGFSVGAPDLAPEVLKAGFDSVIIDHEKNQITFQIQKGPIKENGVNGCQVDTIIKTAWLIIKGLHKNYPCDENVVAMDYLFIAGLALKARKVDRETRGVEGLNKE